MFNPVIIKGNKQGIRLIIDNAAELQEVVCSINNKLKNTKCYYSNIKPIYVTFEGKQLTEDETEIILDTLRKSGLNVALFKKHNYNNTIEKTNKILSEQIGLFYKGTLKSGQAIEADESIVIIGDVEAGASVTSVGNIIVLGRLLGYAKAGIKGNENAFVYSLV